MGQNSPISNFCIVISVNDSVGLGHFQIQGGCEIGNIRRKEDIAKLRNGHAGRI